MTEAVGFERREVWPDRPEDFRTASVRALRDGQTRANLLRATTHIQARRASVVGEMPDWDELRSAGAAIKQRVLRHLDDYLIQVEVAVERAGGSVHFARDASEANQIVTKLVKAHNATEVVKVKSLTTDEFGLNQALSRAGIAALETDLAELICQLGAEHQSHVLVPAVHLSRQQIRKIFVDSMPGVSQDLLDDPSELAGSARRFLRDRFLSAKVAISGANFVVAECGSVVIVESEGNGRMCVTLPEVLITVAGIEKLVPRFGDLEVFLSLLARSATGERANPYTSVFTGVTPGDGPREFHLVLVDNGRTKVLADPLCRQSLQCIKCSACMNVCPVYSRVGGHAYGSVYPGPIGAILTPKLKGLDVAGSLPFASTLCGACADVCPVRIDIPRVLVHLRAESNAAKAISTRTPSIERLAMHALGAVMTDPVAFAAGERLIAKTAPALRAKGGRFAAHLPGPLGAWSDSRDVPIPPDQSFRSWWTSRSNSDPTSRGFEGSPDQDELSRSAQRHQVLKSYCSVVGRTVRTLRLTRRERPASAEVGGARRDPARDILLSSVRDALSDVPSAEVADDVDVPRMYRRSLGMGAADLATLLAERISDYDATVLRVKPAEVASSINTALGGFGTISAVIPADLPDEWLPDEVTFFRDGPNQPLAKSKLEALSATVTGCALAIAETGTIVLDGAERSGRRAISLVPDCHICVVDESQVVGTIAEALQLVDPFRALTLISGPSATSDIELTRIEGVHGPRTLIVLLVAAS